MAALRDNRPMLLLWTCDGGMQYNCRDQNGMILVMHMTIKGHNGLFCLAAMRRKDINVRNREGTTALYVACLPDAPWAVDYLLQRPGINPNLTNIRGRTSLLCIRPQEHDYRGMTPLPLLPSKTTPWWT